jgi:hypothetical protein
MSIVSFPYKPGMNLKNRYHLRFLKPIPEFLRRPLAYPDNTYGQGDVFFAMPLAQTWHPIAMYKVTDTICPLQSKKALHRVAPGQALLCTDICPEKRDEANLPPSDRSLFILALG